MGGEERRRLGCPCRSVRADENGRRRERNQVSAAQRVRKEGRKRMSAVPRIRERNSVSAVPSEERGEVDES
eukprot:2485113-Rhodomonas_salina.1